MLLLKGGVVLVNKNGLMVDTAVMYVIYALVFAFVLVFVILIIGKFNDGIQDTNSSAVPDTVKVNSENSVSKFKRADTAFGFLLFAFVVASIILARKLDELNPVYIFVAILGLVVMGFFGMIVENLWAAFESQSLIGGVTGDLVFVPFIMNNLILVLIVFVAVVSVARLTRNDGGGV